MEQKVEVLKHSYQVFSVIEHIIVKNMKSEPITMVIFRKFRGQSKESTHNGKVSTEDSDLVNSTNKIGGKFKFNLEKP